MLVLGVVLFMHNVSIGLLIILWSINGVFQCTGGPCSMSVMANWITRRTRGRYIGIWNASHNIGGGLAGIFAIWCAQTFFDGNVAGMFIIPAIIAMLVAIATFFIGENRPENLG